MEADHMKILSHGVVITESHTENDRDFVCGNLLNHNIEKTSGLLKKPGVYPSLYLKNGDIIIGAILCDAFNLCLYIDVLWIDESYRGRGYGKALINEAENIARKNGCIFVHTCTFSYQSPKFYKACGYEVFAELNDYPEGIIQYFLKKKL